MFSVLNGAVILLIGLLWTPDPAPDKPDQSEEERKKARQKQARLGILRIICLLVGVLLLVGNLVAGPGRIEDGQQFLLLLILYSGLILMVQRAEKNRRLITLFFMALAAWSVFCYSVSRESSAESNWAIYGSLLINYLFWQIIGRRYPVGSSRDIQVWGMDE